MALLTRDWLIATVIGTQLTTLGCASSDERESESVTEHNGATEFTQGRTTSVSGPSPDLDADAGVSEDLEVLPFETETDPAVAAAESEYLEAAARNWGHGANVLSRSFARAHLITLVQCVSVAPTQIALDGGFETQVSFERIQTIAGPDLREVTVLFSGGTIGETTKSTSQSPLPTTSQHYLLVAVLDVDGRLRPASLRSIDADGNIAINGQVFTPDELREIAAMASENAGAEQ